MKYWHEVTPEKNALSIVENMSKYHLQDLEEAIAFRKREIMHARLSNAGIPSIIKKEFDEAETYYFPYILVYDPNGEKEGTWATVDECQRLLDTVANLSPTDAYNRWLPKVVELEKEYYTLTDSHKDMEAERQKIKQQFSTGEIDSEYYAMAYKDTRDYLNIAKGTH